MASLPALWQQTPQLWLLAAWDTSRSSRARSHVILECESGFMDYGSLDFWNERYLEERKKGSDHYFDWYFTYADGAPPGG